MSDQERDISYSTQSGADHKIKYPLEGGSNSSDGGAATSIDGPKSVFIPSTAMFPRVTNSCASMVYTQINASGPNLPSLSFDASTSEYAQFLVALPKSWDGGTIKAKLAWSHIAATTFGVAWGIKSAIIPRDGSANVNYGSEVIVTDIGGVTDNFYITPESSDITVGGTIEAENENYVSFEVRRITDNGGDTLNVDARLHGMTFIYQSEGGD